MSKDAKINMLEDFTEPHSYGNDAGKLVLRLAVGVLLLLHGMSKIQNPEILHALAPSIEAYKFPASVAWLLLIGELVAPILLILGILTRLAGAAIALQMAIVMTLGNTGALLVFLPEGGYALELHALFLLSGLSITCLGSGYYSLMRD